MSEYHVLESSINGKTIRVVFHLILTPGEKTWTNSAGKSAAWCIVRSRELSEEPMSQLPSFAADFPAEYASMQIGEVIEEVQTIRFSETGLAPADKRSEIEAKYNEWRSDKIDKTQKQFEWYGYSGNVA